MSPNATIKHPSLNRNRDSYFISMILALANVHHNTAICASKFFLPENQNIVRFVEESEFDLIIADPIEILGPLLSWKYDIPLSFNTRWAMYGDAGEILTGKFSLIRNVNVPADCQLMCR